MSSTASVIRGVVLLALVGLLTASLTGAASARSLLPDSVRNAGDGGAADGQSAGGQSAGGGGSATPGEPDIGGRAPTSPSSASSPSDPSSMSPDEPTISGAAEIDDGSQPDEQSNGSNGLETGDTGPAVAELKRQLRAKRYWVGPINDQYDKLARQAVYAFEGVAGLPVDGVADPRMQRALAAATTPAPHGGGGDRIEIDRDNQVLKVVQGGQTRWVFHVSTGTYTRYRHPAGHVALADTPPGRWEIFRRIDSWHTSPLGGMYRPVYFHSDGLAIHGAVLIPPQPASHGCVRITTAAMDFLWDRGFVPGGQTVLVH